MISKVTHLSVFVKDQDEALRFYTEKLGFEVHTDMDFNGSRWLTLNPKGQKDFEITLMPATVETKEQSAPVACFSTDDCRKDYADLKQKGVNFLHEPKDEAWGIGVTFADPSGNVFYLNQTK